MRCHLLSKICIASMLCVTPCFADKPGRNVEPDAIQEIARRGNMVKTTGTVGAVDLIGAALAPPADDSAKWFITLVCKRDDEDSQAMKNTIATSPEMKCWVDVNDSAKSHTFYHIRYATVMPKLDANKPDTQSDWIVGIQPAIDSLGLPCVVLQPPRNGQFGSSATVVKTIHGVCSGKYLSDKLREGIVEYINKIQSPDSSTVSQSDVPVAIAPPFDVPTPRTITPVPEIVQPRHQPLPFEYPPATPQPLTAEQIRQTCPGATADFILRTMESRETNPTMASLRWEVEQAKRPSSNLSHCDQISPLPDDSQSTECPSFFFETPHPGWIAVAILAAFVAGWYLRPIAKLVAVLIVNAGVLIDAARKNQPQNPGIGIPTPQAVATVPVSVASNLPTPAPAVAKTA